MIRTRYPINPHLAPPTTWHVIKTGVFPLVAAAAAGMALWLWAWSTISAPLDDTRPLPLIPCFDTVEQALAAGEQEDSTCITLIRDGQTVVVPEWWAVPSDIRVSP